MTIQTLLQYLFGRRDAILEVAGNKWAVWIGLIFVLSAGFAREYDQEDLLHEPWYLLIPVVASLATSLLLFGLIWIGSFLRNSYRGTFFSNYRSFLGLYWMTAPLAWIYAIPVERYLSPGDATRANLWFLGLVSLWRVLLIARAISVVYEVRFWRAILPVLLFADFVALMLLFLTPLPVINFMGGIRNTESEMVIQSTAFVVGSLGVVTFPIWLLGTIYAFWSRKAAGQIGSQVSGGRVSLPLLSVAVVSIGAWIAILPLTQPEQFLRRQVEKDLRSGRIGEAIETMSARERSDFPPQWDAPPRIGYGEQIPQVETVLEEALAKNAKPWVMSIFTEKYLNQMGNAFGADYFWQRLESKDFDRHLNLLERLPNGLQIVRSMQKQLRWELSEDSNRTEMQKQRISMLLQKLDPS